MLDDSGKGVKPVYVLAGFVLSAYQWRVFAEHWKAILDAAPSIDYFKMQEAWHITGQFARFSTQQRDENNDWHPNDPVDFIFDEQGKEGDMLQLTWSYGLQVMPPAVKPLIGRRPIHRDERDFLPLQAADLFA